MPWRAVAPTPARTERPSSRRTRYIDLGRTSSMIPGWSSSFFVSPPSDSFGSPAEHRTDAACNFRHVAGSIDPAKQALRLVVRHESRGHLLVVVEPFGDLVLAVVGSVFEHGVRGRQTVLQVVNTSSPNVGPAEGRPLHEELPRDLDQHH